MFSKMMRLVNTTDNLYLTPPQQKELLDYAKSMPRRFALARSVEDMEVRLIDTAFEKLQEYHPTIGDLADAGWDTSTNDLRYAIRALVNGMLMDDDQYADGTALMHLRTVLFYYDFPTGLGADLMASLRDACREALPPDAFELWDPYLQTAAEAMAEPVVGAEAR
ncbi:MAG: hypothetical protein ACRCZF_17195 [Gemmataceae bacterium]